MNNFYMYDYMYDDAGKPCSGGRSTSCSVKMMADGLSSLSPVMSTGLSSEIALPAGGLKYHLSATGWFRL